MHSGYNSKDPNYGFICGKCDYKIKKDTNIH
jgi:hypothetical protein